MDLQNLKGSTFATVVSFPSRDRNPQTAAPDKQLLETVLNNMSQGVLMFDSDARLIFCNQRYVEMYGLSPQVLTAGCTLRDLLAHRKSVGGFAEDPDDYITALHNYIANGRPSGNIVKSMDGRA